MRSLRIPVFTPLRTALLAAALAISPLAMAAHANSESTADQLTVARPASSLDITVFSDGAQIEETRQVMLHAGHNRIRLEGIAVQYRQDSLRIIGVSGPSEFNFKSAVHEPASLNQERILANSIGKRVSATVGSGARARRIDGTLKSVQGGQAVITAANGQVYFAQANDVVPARMPNGLSSTASLVVEADVATAGTYSINLVYETEGLSWSATHSLIEAGDHKSVSSYEVTVNVDNRSGTAFAHANLWLMSGGVQQGPGGPRAYELAAASPRMGKSFDAPRVQSVGERKVYRIPGQVSLGDGQNRQFQLFAAKDVPVVHEYYLPASGYNYGTVASGQESVSVRLKLKNCDESHMGMPLPGGDIKVYERNDEGKLQIVSQGTTIRELARDEEFAVSIGTSSDVKAERTLADATKPLRVGNTEYQDRTFNVKIYNYKQVPVDVLVEANVPADQSNIAPLTKKSANIGTASVHVDANTNGTLSYTLTIPTGRVFNDNNN